MTRSIIQDTLLYMSNPARISETVELRAGLRKLLADMPMDDVRGKPLGHPYARKRHNVRPTEILDEA